MALRLLLQYTLLASRLFGLGDEQWLLVTASSPKRSYSDPRTHNRRAFLIEVPFKNPTAANMSASAATNNPNSSVAVTNPNVNATIHTNNNSHVSNLPSNNSGRGVRVNAQPGAAVLGNAHFVNVAPTSDSTNKTNNTNANTSSGSSGGNNTTNNINNTRTKPRPLELSINSTARGNRYNEYHYSTTSTPVTSDDMSLLEILDLMEQVNRAVKGGEFSAFLGTQILRLITQLKKYGSSMENSHQQELNNVFISLRQACCRDSGQLGTMCRLEIMELIEFRAMGWRPNLAHSRYYMKRSCGSIANQDLNYNENAATNETDHLPTAPESAPPFGTVTINPFAFNFPGGAQIASTADLSSLSATPAMAGATPYFLIPASPLSHPQTGIAFISPTANVIAPAIATKPLASGLSHPNIYQKGTPINNPSPPLTSNKMVSKTTSKPNRPLKSSGKNLCRSDIVIRNADSGKVMGVKGRRVAVIEEMSNTIVSFQKVTPNSKDRTITINGPNEEAIELATSLIEETIRRNVSPDRAKSSETGGVDNRQNLSPGKVVHRGGTCSGIIRSGSEEHVGNVKLRNSKRESEMEIMTGDNGEMLKLISANPKLLQTARKALDVYFKSQRGNHEQNSSRNLERHNSSWSFNRRKSLSSLNENLKNLIMETVPELEKDLIQENITSYIGGNMSTQQKLLSARSTPNLADKFGEMNLNCEMNNCVGSVGCKVDINGETVSRLDRTRLTSIQEDNSHQIRYYSREEFIKLSQSPHVKGTSTILQAVARAAPEILCAPYNEKSIEGGSEGTRTDP
ncbi:hypothetical protein T03_6607 [Trichinella britovi]|uniref:K Homology domain-containing protein n=1 Tax=Trichinella britovi TaxID=45882 RepID=A0A0V1DBL0_TRIBR|nr:hypothetical protein T03_6607 [Trichinella britovi]KRY59049.1 hypothetical protein T03_6607 [Trichinella britovi]